MIFQSSDTATQPVLSTWIALDQIAFLIGILRTSTNSLDRLLTATRTDHAAIRRHVRMMTIALESVEAARANLEQSVER